MPTVNSVRQERKRYRFKSREEAEREQQKSEKEARAWLWLYCAEKNGDLKEIHQGKSYSLRWFPSPSGFHDFYQLVFWPKCNRVPQAVFFESCTDCESHLIKETNCRDARCPEQVDFRNMLKALPKFRIN
jgi:hypothetical protein